MLSLLRRVVKPFVVRLAHRRNQRRAQAIVASGRAPGPADWGATVSEQGHLELGGCRLADLALAHGTPLHVIHEDRLAANYTHFLKTFRAVWPAVEVGYSYKTNPLPGALEILHRAGAIAEVISHFELWLALRLGVPPERIVFNGPGKTPDGLKLAVESGVKIINLDNPDEADQIQRFAAAADRRQAVGVRVVTSVGWANQFGVPLAGGAALAVFDRIARLDRLEPRALHIHLGTGIKDVRVYAQAVGELVAFAAELKQTRGITIDFFDLGGGFGVPTVAPLTPMDERLLAAGYPLGPIDTAATPPLSVYAEAIAGLMRGRFDEGKAPTLFFEPGRAVSSSAQALLLRVLAVKPGPAGSRNVILDGGHNLAIPTGYERHEILPTEGLGHPADATHHFFGPLCHPGDVLARECRLPALAVGDVVAMMDAGAYFIPNQMNFSNPRPAVVIAKDGVARLTRAAESFEHMVSLDRVGHA